MSENNVSVDQRVAKGGTANGVVNNYYGIALTDAMTIMTDLFEKNFPKLQEKAMETVQTRVEELRQEICNLFQEQQITNYSAFEDPDVQYVFNEAQRNYARFGNQESLKTIARLLVKRIQNNDQKDLLIHVAMDRAVSIAGTIKESHLDTLSLIFLAKHTKISGIDTIERLKELLTVLASTFSKASANTLDSLNLHGCLTIKLQNAAQAFSITYGLDSNAVKQILPPVFSCVPGDYGLSPTGIVLAIVNAEQKMGSVFDPHIWIHD